MGMQQVLLIVLSVVLVGVSIAAGIYTFQVQAKNMHRQSMIKQMTDYVGEAITFRRIPTNIGGGGGSFIGFYPAGAVESSHVAGNSPGGVMVESEEVNYFVEWYFNDRLKIIVSSKLYGEGNYWNNTYNARITAVYSNLGEIDSNGYEITGDGEGTD